MEFLPLLQSIGGSDNPLLDSRLIVARALRRYQNAIQWIESELKPDTRIADTLQGLSDEGRMFLFRSGPLRSYVDRICSLLYSTVENDRQLANEWHGRLASIVIKASDESSGAKDETNRLSQIGFDISNPLSDPYPVVVSSWDPPVSNSWSESAELDALFNEYMALGVGVERCALRSMNSAQKQMIEKSIAFLFQLEPTAAYDVVLNVRHFCLFDYSRWPSMSDSDYREVGQSVSSHLVPNACFISGYSLAAFNRCAESIYHEALHKKLSNLFVTDSIVSDDFDTSVAPSFLSYWNKNTEWNSNLWGFDRALYAFHVYAHLFVFYGAAIETGQDEILGKQWSLNRHHVSRERADAIGSWLRQEGWDHLGESGRELVNVLSSTLHN